ncbi:motility associated factor glycosyltransferase family protein [Lysinibacillus sp. NPDC094403]|uniref:motility associated factor glycosyltransferase family protein n=1 Tax=Lysinibacillus sp. NPDC094403 TaxID=3390581 RepID=UPI003D01B0F8
MFELEYENTKSNLPTLKVNNVYLHSKYNPVREAETYILKNFKPARLQILIGYGNGYIFEALKSKISTDDKILVIEPIDAIKNLNIDIHYTTQDELKKYFDKNITVVDRINMIVSNNYDVVVPQQVMEILEVLNEKIKSNQIIENTLKRFSLSWDENYVKSLKYGRVDYSIEKLINKYNQPVVVASSGPSLMKQLPLLKEFKDKIIIIASGSTINSLLAHDIEPDYVVSIDGVKENFNHYKNIKENNITLIYCPLNYFAIREKFQKAYYFIQYAEHQIIDHYSKYTGDNIGILQGGGSVANAALNLAFFMTDAPVALIGQDLAYTGGYSHSTHNLNNKKLDEESMNKEIIKREGYYGDEVLTNFAFLQMKDSFNSIIQNYQVKDRVYNCTEGGLKIEEINQLSFYEFLKKYTNTQIEREEERCQIKYSMDKLSSLLNEDILNIKELIALLEQSIKTLYKDKSSKRYSEKVLKKLVKMDNKTEVLIKKLGLERAFSFINLNAVKYYAVDEKENEEVQFQKSFKQSSYLYEEMLEATKRTLFYYEEEVKELSK